MHLSLSDLVTCPRCGPSHGLVLLPHAVEARRVWSGVLGCANCRERYTIEAGVADLRVEGVGGGVTAEASGVNGPGETGRPGETGTGAGASGASAGEPGVRLGALLDLAEGGGPVLLAGPARSEAAALAELIEGIEVVHVGGASDPAVPGGRVSAVLAGAGLPFRTGSMSGVALTGAYADWLEEGLRVVRPGARVLVEPGGGLTARAEATGGRVLVAEGDVLVLVRVR